MDCRRSFMSPDSTGKKRKITATIIMSRSGKRILRSAARVRLASFLPISVRMEMPMAIIRGNSTSRKENTVPGSSVFAAHSTPKLIPPASAVPNQPSAAVSRISAAYAA